LSIESEPQRIETLYDREFALYMLGEHKRSIEYANKILELEPDNAFTLINKSRSLAKLGNDEDALATIDHALSIDPNNALAQQLRKSYLKKLAHSKEPKILKRIKRKYGHYISKIKNNAKALESESKKT